MQKYGHGQGAYIFGCSSTSLLQEERDFFQEVDPFGFILFSRNIENGTQLISLCNDLRSTVASYAPIFVDQEGGRVQRLRAPMVTEWPTPSDHVRLAGAKAKNIIFSRYALIAQELRSFGITVNCAPLADIARPETHFFLKNRCFGSSANVVVEMALAAANGLLYGGALPVIKHIPGHGSVLVDSHESPPITSASLEVLEEIDFLPFKQLNHLPMGMTAHVIYEAIDKIPGTISPKVNHVIRSMIGFNGLLISDDISMGALTGSACQRASAVIRAGCDIVLHCNGKLREMEEIVKGAGNLSEESAFRAGKMINLHSQLADWEVDTSFCKAQLGMDALS